MQRFVSIRTIGAAAVIALGAATAASATTVSVAGSADLYNASGTFQGDSPVAIDVTGLASVTFSVSGSVIVNHGSGDSTNDADGVGSASGETIQATSTMSGIQTSTAGFLAGAFFGATVSSTVPATLNFSVSGTSFSTLSPLLQQTFFIGDGLTGDGTGSTQTFYVPAGATTLYLGITDACGYNGSPSCYDDNLGSFTVVTQSASAVPEPAGWGLSLAGLAGIALVARRRRV